MSFVSDLKNKGRAWARRNLLTYNTIRYRVEFPRLEEAFRSIGKQKLVVDGGAGGGQMLRQIYEAGLCERGIGLEFDPNLFTILKGNFANTPDLDCVAGSLLEIPFADASVDCVMTTQVLEHIVEHEKAASELGRIVKPGGHLIISVPHPPEPFHTPGHIREGYTEADLVALFPASHYDLLSTGYSMTRPTMDRTVRAGKLPLGGFYIPVAWADRETKLSPEERKNQLPYGITCLFRKKS
jgi:SAM-dependent methyltransferase